MALKKLDTEALARKQNRLNAEEGDGADDVLPLETYVTTYDILVSNFIQNNLFYFYFFHLKNGTIVFICSIYIILLHINLFYIMLFSLNLFHLLLYLFSLFFYFYRRPVPDIDDMGIGVFPPEPGSSEPGARYLQLPAIIDQEVSVFLSVCPCIFSFYPLVCVHLFAKIWIFFYALFIIDFS